MALSRASCLLVVMLIPVAWSRADLLTVTSDGSWRAIGPVGNLAGQPFTAGAEWEQQNVGWNSLPDYNDSDDNGWMSAIHVDPSGHPIRIWADGDGNHGSTPAYFRKEFHIPGPPTAGLIDLVVDDDAEVYVNGTLVFASGTRPVIARGLLQTVAAVPQVSSLHAFLSAAAAREK